MVNNGLANCKSRISDDAGAAEGVDGCAGAVAGVMVGVVGFPATLDGGVALSSPLTTGLGGVAVTARAATRAGAGTGATECTSGTTISGANCATGCGAALSSVTGARAGAGSGPAATLKEGGGGGGGGTWALVTCSSSSAGHSGSNSFTNEG